MSSVSNLHNARSKKNDEFYTCYADIEEEVTRYKDQFYGKIVLCNCDNPEWSNFWKFFHNNFSEFHLKKLISTHYEASNSSYAMIYDGVSDEKIPLVKEHDNSCGQISLFDIYDTESNGDFRSAECLKYLEEADIVCTNPPFSLFREFIMKVFEYNKKVLVIENKNALKYNEIFPLIKENKLWLGYSSPSDFVLPDGEITKNLTGLCRWFTNLDTNKRHEELALYKNYNEEDYPKFDHYDAINVNKTMDIPCDYYEPMGAPITFFDKYSPEQFEIIDCIGRYSAMHNEETRKAKKFLSMVNGEYLYERVIIQRKYDNDGNKINKKNKKI